MIDLDALVAIDVHTHVQASVHGGSFPEDSPEAAVAKVFGSDLLLTVPQLAAHYRERKMACVAFMVDTVRWPHPVSNEEILELAAAEQDVLLPDERMAYPLYEVIAEHRLPAVFHTGQTAVGSGQRGGGGILLKHSNPIHLDEVAADFPEMTIVMAHPSVPWQDEALSIAVHKPNVYIDLSGWSPKYFPPQLVRYANTLLKEKVLFGTDFPALTPERWLADFDTLDVKPEVRPLILKGNPALIN